MASLNTKVILVTGGTSGIGEACSRHFATIGARVVIASNQSDRGVALEKELRDAGNEVRVYVPFGTQWYRYFMRRLAGRPANLAFFMRALADRGH